MADADPSESAIPVTQSTPQPASWDRAPVTFGQGISAVAEEALTSSPTASLLEMGNLHALEQDRDSAMVNPDEYNKAHPELETPLTKPVPKSFADELSNRALQRRERASVIARAPETLAYKGASLGTGLGLGLIDPISIAGFGAVGAALPAASGIMGFGRAFAEGALGSIPGEAVTATERSVEGIDTTAGDFAKSAAMSGGGLMGVHLFGMGIKSAWKRVVGVDASAPAGGPSSGGGPSASSPRDALVRQFGEPVTAQMEKVAQNQMAAGERVDLSPAIEAAHLSTSGDVDPPPGAAFPKYEHEPVTSLEGKRFFYGSPSSLGDFAEAPKRVIGQDLGDGIYLSDNPWRENGAASGSLEGVPGKLHEVSIDPKTKLLNLDEPLSGDVRSIVEPYMDEIHGKQAPEMLDTLSGREVMDEIKGGVDRGEIPETAHSDIQQAVGSAGYDGYQFVDKGETGGGPHNVAMLFDHDQTGDAGGKIAQSRTFEPDQGSVPTLSPERQSTLLQDHGSPKRDALYDPELHADLEKRMTQGPDKEHLHSLKKHIDDLMEQAQILRDQGALSEKESSLLDALKDFDGDVEDHAQAIKSMAVCLRSG